MKLHFTNKILLVYIMLFLPMFIYGQDGDCKIRFDEGVTMINGRTNASSVKPGDTICLLPGTRQFLWFSYLHGTKEKPIIIINVDGLVTVTGHYYGVKIDSCSFIKFSGKGFSTILHGININNINGAGMSIEGLSTDIEVEGVEIGYTELAGVFAKSDPTCSFVSTREKYVFRNLSMHDNYFHHSGMEGMYIGNSFFLGYTLNCNGKDTLVFPHLIKGVKIFNNRIEHTAWDGIQVSSSDSACYIYNNTILYDSESAVANQMSGILSGGGSVCDCFNNAIKDGKGDGIDVFGQGGQRFYNNLIVNAGQNNPNEKHGIYVGNTSTIPGSSYSFFYNTIITPKTSGIKFTNLPSKNNLISNNIIIQNSGNYIVIPNPSVSVSVENNYLGPDFSEIAFIDYSQGKYDLQPSSPAVNTGSSVPSILPDYDILYRSRPFATFFDKGAFECHDSSLYSIRPEQNFQVSIESLFPNPGKDQVILRFTLHSREKIGISVFNFEGQNVYEQQDIQMSPGKNDVKINTREFPAGYYYCIIRTINHCLTKKIIITGH